MDVKRNIPDITPSKVKKDRKRLRIEFLDANKDKLNITVIKFMIFAQYCLFQDQIF